MLDKETVRQHIREYHKHGKLRIETGGSDGKLSMEQMWELFAHLEAYTYSKADDIRGYVRKQYGVCYTLSGMTAWLKNYGFSYKQPKPTPHKADPVAQQAFIEHYEDLQAHTPLDEPYCIYGRFPPDYGDESFVWLD